MRSEEEILREAGEVGMELASLKNRVMLLANPTLRPWVIGTVRTKLGDWGVKSRKLYDHWRLPSELEEKEGR